jgi:hypothetical protein
MSKPVEVKLGPAVFQSLKEILFKQGESHPHDALFDILHEEACDAVDIELTAAEYDYNELDDDQRHELIDAYKAGFWEPTHKDERRELKEQVADLYNALADKTASAPCTPDPRFPGMFVPRVPTLSLNHLPLKDAARLCDPADLAHPAVIGASSDGAILHIGDLSDDIENEFAGFSEAFRNIVLRLTEAGYNYVRFDATHETVESFPTFDW